MASGSQREGRDAGDEDDSDETPDCSKRWTHAGPQIDGPWKNLQDHYGSRHSDHDRGHRQTHFHAAKVATGSKSQGIVHHLREGAGRPSQGKKPVLVTLTAANVDKAKARGKNFSGLLDGLLAEWIDR